MGGDVIVPLHSNSFLLTGAQLLILLTKQVSDQLSASGTVWTAKIDRGELLSEQNGGMQANGHL